MKRLLFLTIVSLVLAGCVAFPVYDSGYYYPYYYAPYPYYAGPEISVFVPLRHGGHAFHGGHGFRGGDSFRGSGGFRGGDGFRGGQGGFRGGRR